MAAVAKKAIYAPLTSQAWAQCTYKFNEQGDFFGVWYGSEGHTTFAPESGQLILLQGGSYSLDIEDADMHRLWIVGEIEDLDKNFKSGQVVEAGQPLGKLSKPLYIALWVTLKNDPQEVSLDPATFFQQKETGTQFKDLENLPAELIHPEAGIQFDTSKKQLTNGQALGLAAATGGVLGLLGWALGRR